MDLDELRRGRSVESQMARYDVLVHAVSAYCATPLLPSSSSSSSSSGKGLSTAAAATSAFPVSALSKPTPAPKVTGMTPPFQSKMEGMCSQRSRPSSAAVLSTTKGSAPLVASSLKSGPSRGTGGASLAIRPSSASAVVGERRSRNVLEEGGARSRGDEAAKPPDDDQFLDRVTQRFKNRHTVQDDAERMIQHGHKSRHHTTANAAAQKSSLPSSSRVRERAAASIEVVEATESLIPFGKQVGEIPSFRLEKYSAIIRIDGEKELSDAAETVNNANRILDAKANVANHLHRFEMNQMKRRAIAEVLNEDAVQAQHTAEVIAADSRIRVGEMETEGDALDRAEYNVATHTRDLGNVINKLGELKEEMSEVVVKAKDAASVASTVRRGKKSVASLTTLTFPSGLSEAGPNAETGGSATAGEPLMRGDANNNSTSSNNNNTNTNTNALYEMQATHLSNVEAKLAARTKALVDALRVINALSVRHQRASRQHSEENTALLTELAKVKLYTRALETGAGFTNSWSASGVPHYPHYSSHNDTSGSIVNNSSFGGGAGAPPCLFGDDDTIDIKLRGVLGIVVDELTGGASGGGKATTATSNGTSHNSTQPPTSPSSLPQSMNHLHRASNGSSFAINTPMGNDLLQLADRASSQNPNGPIAHGGKGGDSSFFLSLDSPTISSSQSHSGFATPAMVSSRRRSLSQMSLFGRNARGSGGGGADSEGGSPGSPHHLTSGGGGGYGGGGGGGPNGEKNPSAETLKAMRQELEHSEEELKFSRLEVDRLKQALAQRERDVLARDEQLSALRQTTEQRIGKMNSIVVEASEKAANAETYKRMSATLQSDLDVLRKSYDALVSATARLGITWGLTVGPDGTPVTSADAYRGVGGGDSGSKGISDEARVVIATLEEKYIATRAESQSLQSQLVMFEQKRLAMCRGMMSGIQSLLVLLATIQNNAGRVLPLTTTATAAAAVAMQATPNGGVGSGTPSAAPLPLTTAAPGGGVTSPPSSLPSPQSAALPPQQRQQQQFFPPTMDLLRLRHTTQNRLFEMAAEGARDLLKLLETTAAALAPDTAAKSNTKAAANKASNSSAAENLLDALGVGAAMEKANTIINREKPPHLASPNPLIGGEGGGSSGSGGGGSGFAFGNGLPFTYDAVAEMERLNAARRRVLMDSIYDDGYYGYNNYGGPSSSRPSSASTHRGGGNNGSGGVGNTGTSPTSAVVEAWRTDLQYMESLVLRMVRMTSKYQHEQQQHVGSGGSFKKSSSSNHSPTSSGTVAMVASASRRTSSSSSSPPSPTGGGKGGADTSAGNGSGGALTASSSFSKGKGTALSSPSSSSSGSFKKRKAVAANPGTSEEEKAHSAKTSTTKVTKAVGKAEGQRGAEKRKKTMKVDSTFPSQSSSSSTTLPFIAFADASPVSAALLSLAQSSEALAIMIAKPLQGLVDEARRRKGKQKPDSEEAKKISNNKNKDAQSTASTCSSSSSSDNDVDEDDGGEDGKRTATSSITSLRVALADGSSPLLTEVLDAVLIEVPQEACKLHCQRIRRRIGDRIALHRRAMHVLSHVAMCRSRVETGGAGGGGSRASVGGGGEMLMTNASSLLTTSKKSVRINEEGNTASSPNDGTTTHATNLTAGGTTPSSLSAAAGNGILRRSASGRNLRPSSSSSSNSKAGPSSSSPSPSFPSVAAANMEAAKAVVRSLLRAYQKVYPPILERNGGTLQQRVIAADGNEGGDETKDTIGGGGGDSPALVSSKRSKQATSMSRMLKGNSTTATTATTASSSTTGLISDITSQLATDKSAWCLATFMSHLKRSRRQQEEEQRMHFNPAEEIVHPMSSGTMHVESFALMCLYRDRLALLKAIAPVFAKIQRDNNSRRRSERRLQRRLRSSQSILTSLGFSSSFASSAADSIENVYSVSFADGDDAGGGGSRAWPTTDLRPLPLPLSSPSSSSPTRPLFPSDATTANTLNRFGDGGAEEKDVTEKTSKKKEKKDAHKRRMNTNRDTNNRHYFGGESDVSNTTSSHDATFAMLFNTNADDESTNNNNTAQRRRGVGEREDVVSSDAAQKRTPSSELVSSAINTALIRTSSPPHDRGAINDDAALNSDTNHRSVVVNTPLNIEAVSAFVREQFRHGLTQFTTRSYRLGRFGAAAVAAESKKKKNEDGHLLVRCSSEGAASEGATIAADALDKAEGFNGAVVSDDGSVEAVLCANIQRIIADDVAKATRNFAAYHSSSHSLISTDTNNNAIANSSAAKCSNAIATVGTQTSAVPPKVGLRLPPSRRNPNTTANPITTTIRSTSTTSTTSANRKVRNGKDLSAGDTTTTTIATVGGGGTQAEGDDEDAIGEEEEGEQEGSILLEKETLLQHATAILDELFGADESSNSSGGGSGGGGGSREVAIAKTEGNTMDVDGHHVNDDGNRNRATLPISTPAEDTAKTAANIMKKSTAAPSAGDAPAPHHSTLFAGVGSSAGDDHVSDTPAFYGADAGKPIPPPSEAISEKQYLIDRIRKLEDQLRTTKIKMSEYLKELFSHKLLNGSSGGGGGGRRGGKSQQQQRTVRILISEPARFNLTREMPLPLRINAGALRTGTATIMTTTTTTPTRVVGATEEEGGGRAKAPSTATPIDSVVSSPSPSSANAAETMSLIRGDNGEQLISDDGGVPSRLSNSNTVNSNTMISYEELNTPNALSPPKERKTRLQFVGNGGGGLHPHSSNKDTGDAVKDGDHSNEDADHPASRDGEGQAGGDGGDSSTLNRSHSHSFSHSSLHDGLGGGRPLSGAAVGLRSHLNKRLAAVGGGGGKRGVVSKDKSVGCDFTSPSSPLRRMEYASLSQNLLQSNATRDTVVDKLKDRGAIASALRQGEGERRASTTSSTGRVSLSNRRLSNFGQGDEDYV